MHRESSWESNKRLMRSTKVAKDKPPTSSMMNHEYNSTYLQETRYSSPTWPFLPKQGRTGQTLICSWETARVYEYIVCMFTTLFWYLILYELYGIYCNILYTGWKSFTGTYRIVPKRGNWLGKHNRKMGRVVHQTTKGNNSPPQKSVCSQSWWTPLMGCIKRYLQNDKKLYLLNLRFEINVRDGWVKATWWVFALFTFLAHCWGLGEWRIRQIITLHN